MKIVDFFERRNERMADVRDAKQARRCIYRKTARVSGALQARLVSP
jgi:hypothetical protein